MSTSSSRQQRLPVIGLAPVAAAAGLRGLRLGWQPLWWDEGYSIYFATEPLGRMLWLTAHDIHPPLYYALLHGWTALRGQAPNLSDFLSALIGDASIGVIAWLAMRSTPERRAVAWVAALLLALSPMHLFYSQEVRMYGLAMLLGMLSSGLLWLCVAAHKWGSAQVDRGLAMS